VTAPLPFTCGHEIHTPGAVDDHGDSVPVWAAAVERDCFWWMPTTAEPASPPTGGDRVTADVVLVLDSAVPVDHRDRFTVDGKTFEVIGLAADYDHGPYGFAPNRRVVNLKWVG
jgi:hypothetical protein